MKLSAYNIFPLDFNTVVSLAFYFINNNLIDYSLTTHPRALKSIKLESFIYGR